MTTGRWGKTTPRVSLCILLVNEICCFFHTKRMPLQALVVCHAKHDDKLADFCWEKSTMHCKIDWCERKDPARTATDCRAVRCASERLKRYKGHSRGFGVYQDDGKGGLSLRRVAVTTETAIAAETAEAVKTVKVASWSCIL